MKIADGRSITVLVVVVLIAAALLWSPYRGHPRAPAVSCQTNLHDIAMGLKMYKEDNTAYPATIGGYVQRDKSGKVVPIDYTRPDAAHGNGLYREYTKSTKTFHCPLSPSKRTDAVVTLRIGGKTREYYAYDSYDVYSPGEGDQSVGPNEVRYSREWAESPKAVGKWRAYPPGTTDTPTIRNNDHERQLKWRNPPDNTVVTWCSYHEKMVDQRQRPSVPVLFLDGHIDIMHAAEVNACGWRTLPKVY